MSKQTAVYGKMFDFDGVEVHLKDGGIELSVTPLDRPDYRATWLLTQDEARDLRDELTRRLTPAKM